MNGTFLFISRQLSCVVMAIGAVLLVGCATIPPDAGRNPADPFERYNRHVTAFNERVDAAVLKPVAQFYADYTPAPVRDCVGNVFANIWDVPTALNNLLQGKLTETASDLCRVAINSTIGLLGCFDVASKMGLQKNDEDFGQTLGRWGAEPGPYFVWPILGPSTVRDSIGRVAGFYTDPVGYVDHVRVRNSIYGVRLIDTRASLLEAERLINGAALDRYQFLRDAYLQRRRNQVYDGDPPEQKDVVDDYEDAEEAEDVNGRAVSPPAQAPEAPAP